MTTVALAGNPNCGKTALFNLLTGSRQRVGNWPGVTVEKKSGALILKNDIIEIIDLPGIYSLSMDESSASIDERIAYDYLTTTSPDCVINIVDGAHLERNLYLTSQLLEMHIPMIVVVNMMDIVLKRGIALDLKKMQKKLGCVVVAMSANSGQGLEQLKIAILQMKENSAAPTWKLLSPKQLQSLQETHREDADIVMADARYGWVTDITDQITTHAPFSKKNSTQWIDRIVLNRFLGIPLFLFVMYFMFLFAINLGGAFQDFFDISSQTIFIHGIAYLLSLLHASPWFIAIIANGVGKGINTTLTFIPVLGAMFFFMSFLEDSGYMARAAFVVDRAMRALGLPGKSFVPMIVGLGCNVPAVMGARTLSNPRDRILTVMMMPFMSCGARLAIFSVFVAAFFKTGGQDIIFVLYLIGIFMAVLTGFLLRMTVLKGETWPLIMELPSYHLPKLSVLCRQTWQRLKGFIFRAGRVIVPVCVLIGALNSISVSGKLITPASHQSSLLSVVGREVTPILSPMGVEKENWPATVGLVTGILAKEVVIGTLNTLYSQVGHITQASSSQFQLWGGLHDAMISIPKNLAGLASAFANPLVASEPPSDMNHAVYGVMAKFFNGKLGAFCYLLFILLYFPCVATMATMRRELSFRWAIFSVCWSTGLAYVTATLVYQAARFW